VMLMNLCRQIQNVSWSINEDYELQAKNSCNTNECTIL
jgi:hypothetical protein